MDPPEMISNESYRTDGKAFNSYKRSQGSVYTFRVGSRSFTLYSVVIGGLGLLNAILLLTAVVLGIYCGQAGQESDPSHQTSAEFLLVEVKELQNSQSAAIKARVEFEQDLANQQRITDQLKQQLQQNKTISDQIQKRLELLQVEKATLLSNKSADSDSCGTCLPGWILLNTTCYLFSKSSSRTTMSWADSRKDCRNRGGDLVVIDSFDEQVMLFEYMPRVGPGMWWNQGVWIGLSDLHAEGNWTWVNNSTLEQGYWIEGEPNNWGSGEDCAVLLRTPGENRRSSWYDVGCHQHMQWLCEMRPQSAGLSS